MRRGVVQVIAAAVVLGAIGLISVAVQQPVLVPSLASAAFLQILLPDQSTAKPWSIGVGQLIGAACGFACVHLVGAVGTPSFMGDQPLMLVRVLAVALAVGATMAIQLAFKATSAAGGTLALFLALGTETPDLAGIARTLAGVALATGIGEVARRIVLAIEAR